MGLQAEPVTTRLFMTLPFSPYHEIASIIARFADTDGEFKTPIGSVFLNRRSAPTQPLHTAYRPCFALVVQGTKSLQLGSDTFRYGAGHYLLTSLDLPVISRVTEASAEVPHLCLAMAIESERLRDLLGRVNIPRPASTDGMRGMAVNIAPPELLDASVRLLRLLDRPGEIAAMAPLIEQEILYRILTGPDGPRLLHIAMAESHSNKIARAVAWLKENYARILRIEELADHIGMSVSSFHHHFKAVTAMTPMQFQKQLRLHEARRLMLVEQLDAGTAGHRVGYQSPSQFSREYSRLYGLSPMRDVDGTRHALAAE
jgi:AraC-like DNA-binding protein